MVINTEVTPNNNAGEILYSPLFDVEEFDMRIAEEESAKAAADIVFDDRGEFYPTGVERHPELVQHIIEDSEPEVLPSPSRIYKNETGLFLLDPIDDDSVPSRSSLRLVPYEPRPETQHRPLNLSAKLTALGGLKRVVKSIKSNSVNAFEAANDKARSLNINILSAVGSLAEKASQIELSPRHNKKTIAALGGLAIVSVAAYSAHKFGMHIGNFSPAEHSAASLNPAKSANTIHQAVTPAKEAIKPHVQATNVHTAHKAAQAHQAISATKEVNVESGQGYTQVLQRMFPNHNPNAYLGGYKEALKHFGPNFLKGIHHYRMSGGDWGLSGSGKAHLTKPAAEFLSKYFSSH